MNPALMYPRLRSLPSVERGGLSDVSGRRLEPKPKLRMNPALMYSRLRSLPSVELGGASAVSWRCLEPKPKLRMNPALTSEWFSIASSTQFSLEDRRGRRRQFPFSILAPRTSSDVASVSKNVESSESFVPAPQDSMMS
jgi:hypothetical protein